MKNFFILSFLGLFLVGCQHFEGHSSKRHMDEQVTGIDGRFSKGISVKPLPKEIRKALGLKPDDLMIVLRRNKDRIFYFDEENAGFKKIREFPQGKQLLGQTTIYLLKGSPECMIIGALGFPEYLSHPSPPC